MARLLKSYSELQRQHITTELRQREAVTRQAALTALQTAWQTASDDLATAPSLVKVDVVNR